MVLADPGGDAVGAVVECCNNNGQPYVLTLQRCSVAGETCTTNATPPGRSAVAFIGSGRCCLGTWIKYL